MSTRNHSTKNPCEPDGRKVRKEDVKSFAHKVSVIAAAIVLAQGSRIKDMELLQKECTEDSNIVLSWKLGIYDGVMASFVCSLTAAEAVIHGLVMAELADVPTDSENYAKSYMKAALAVLKRLGVRAGPVTGNATEATKKGET